MEPGYHAVACNFHDLRILDSALLENCKARVASSVTGSLKISFGGPYEIVSAKTQALLYSTRVTDTVKGDNIKAKHSYLRYIEATGQVTLVDCEVKTVKANGSLSIMSEDVACNPNLLEADGEVILNGILHCAEIISKSNVSLICSHVDNVKAYNEVFLNESTIVNLTLIATINKPIIALHASVIENLIIHSFLEEIHPVITGIHPLSIKIIYHPPR